MSIDQLLEQLAQKFSSLPSWAEQNPWMVSLSIIVNVVTFLGFFVAIFKFFRAKKERDDEKRQLLELQKSSDVVSQELAQYKMYFSEVFNEVDVSRQLKAKLAEKQQAVDDAQKALGEVNLSIEERNQLLAQQEEALESLEAEKQRILAERQDDLKKMEERLRQAAAAAKNEALRETIMKRLQILENEIQDIENLKAEYTLTDQELNLPLELKNKIRNDLREMVPQPKDPFPQIYLVKILFLTLVFIVLPWPVDQAVMLLAAIPVFIFLIDVVKYIDNPSLTQATRKWYRIALFLGLYSLWFGLVSWLKGLVDPFINPLVDQLRNQFQQSNLPKVLTNDYYLRSSPISASFPGEVFVYLYTTLINIWGSLVVNLV